MTVGGRVGLSSTHPSALNPDWSLRYRRPLIRPRKAPCKYLLCIQISSRTAALTWQTTWATQILPALAWAQVAMGSGYARMVVMRAPHKAVCLVYSASPWDAENTMHVVYAIAHHQSCARHHVATRLLHWLHNNAKWHEQNYTVATTFDVRMS